MVASGTKVEVWFFFDLSVLFRPLSPCLLLASFSPANGKKTAEMIPPHATRALPKAHKRQNLRSTKTPFFYIFIFFFSVVLTDCAFLFFRTFNNKRSDRKSQREREATKLLCPFISISSGVARKDSQRITCAGRCLFLVYRQCFFFGRGRGRERELLVLLQCVFFFFHHPPALICFF